MRSLELASRVARGAFHGFRAVARPARNIHSLIALGDILTELKGYQIALDRLRRDRHTDACIRERYAPGFPPLQECSNFGPGSLGEAYARWMNARGLSPYWGRPAEATSDIEYLRERRREIHDLLHVVLGYDTTLTGEASVNAFLAARSGMPTCIFIVVGVVLRTVLLHPDELEPLLDAVAAAWSRGKESRSPFGVRWEELWSTDLSAARARLRRSDIPTVS